MTPPPGRARSSSPTGWELEQAVAAVLAEHDVAGLLEVSLDAARRPAGPSTSGAGRGGPDRPKTTEWDDPLPDHGGAPPARRRSSSGWSGWAGRCRSRIAPAERLSLSESLAAYRGGWSLERDFHLFKDRPLGIRPLYVRRDDQVVGLTHLVTLALRVLTLFEVLVRRGQEQSGEKLTGVVPRSSESHDGPSDRQAGAGGDHASRDHREPGGERGTTVAGI